MKREPRDGGGTSPWEEDFLAGLERCPSGAEVRAFVRESLEFGVSEEDRAWALVARHARALDEEGLAEICRDCAREPQALLLNPHASPLWYEEAVRLLAERLFYAAGLQRPRLGWVGEALERFAREGWLRADSLEVRQLEEVVLMAGRPLVGVEPVLLALSGVGGLGEERLRALWAALRQSHEGRQVTALVRWNSADHDFWRRVLRHIARTKSGRSEDRSTVQAILADPRLGEDEETWEALRQALLKRFPDLLGEAALAAPLRFFHPLLRDLIPRDAEAAVGVLERAAPAQLARVGRGMLAQLLTSPLPEVRERALRLSSRILARSVRRSA